MSVIVKGICKPIECDSTYYRCQFLNDTDDCKLQDCDPDWSWEEQYKGCPLIEIPEAARLIDAKRLKAVFDKNVASANAFDVIFDNAPTVFEED